MSDTDAELLDEDLHEEIELVGEVVAAVAGFPGPLDDEQIDRALGVSEGAESVESACSAGDEPDLS